MTLGQQHWVETPYDTRALDLDSLTLAVEPAERVGAPLPNRHKTRLRRLFAGIVLICGAWALVASVGLPGVIASARSLFDVVVSQAKDIASRVEQSRTVGPASAPSPADPLVFASEGDQSGAAAPLPEIAVRQDEKAASAVEPPSTETLGEAYAEKPEPEEAKDNAPKRKRAVEAGLSPDLPNVLLTRLTAADLKNAAYAIKTALVKTADDAQFSWPPKPSQQQALFEIRFVQGAAEGCRRYIVTVTKDRWSSTSAALEKCGSVHASAG